MGLFALSQTVPDLELGDSLQERASSPQLPHLIIITLQGRLKLNGFCQKSFRPNEHAVLKPLAGLQRVLRHWPLANTPYWR